jgi:ATP-dependent Clp protease ATP-binding subunit ClpB
MTATSGGIRFFTEACWSFFTMIAQSVKRVILFWSRVDSVACWLAMGMLFLALVLDSGFCFLMAIGAIGCLSIAAWRDERWNLKGDAVLAGERFRESWNRESSAKGGSASQPLVAQPASSPRTKFTGVGEMESSPPDVLGRFSRQFAAKITGQKQAHDLISSRLQGLSLGTRPRSQAPVSFLFAGPTGTGKGEVAALIAEATGRAVVKFNMGEYNNDHTLWTLLGSPKGHVNEEEGLLTRAVRNDPRSVLFLDEIEKGHPRLYDIFLSILDDRDGTFGDPKTGQKLRCGDLLVIFASNLLSDITAEKNATQNGLRDELRASGALRSEFVARISAIIPFYQLTAEELWLITERQLAAYLEDVCDRRRYTPAITVDRDVVRHLVSCQDPKYGARNVKASIEELVEPALREALVEIGNRQPSILHVRKTQAEKLEVATQ